VVASLTPSLPAAALVRQQTAAQPAAAQAVLKRAGQTGRTTQPAMVQSWQGLAQSASSGRDLPCWWGLQARPRGETALIPSSSWSKPIKCFFPKLPAFSFEAVSLTGNCASVQCLSTTLAVPLCISPPLLFFRHPQLLNMSILCLRTVLVLPSAVYPPFVACTPTSRFSAGAPSLCFTLWHSVSVT